MQASALFAQGWCLAPVIASPVVLVTLVPAAVFSVLVSELAVQLVVVVAGAGQVSVPVLLCVAADALLHLCSVLHASHVGLVLD